MCVREAAPGDAVSLAGLLGELGYPVINVRATLTGGQMDQELSNEVAFQAAGADAVHKALRDNMRLLEPEMHVEVTVPDVPALLAGRGLRVETMGQLNDASRQVAATTQEIAAAAGHLATLAGSIEVAATSAKARY